MPPELGSREGEVPELVDEGPHTLLLRLQPDVVPVTSLRGGGREMWTNQKAAFNLLTGSGTQ